jgi:hypothetical protein
MDITIEGKVIAIGAVEHVWQSQLPKRTIVIEEISDKEWKWSIAVDLLKEKTAMAEDIAIGDTIKVSINSRANQYNDRRYTSLSAWKLEKKNGATWTVQSSPKTQYSEIDDELPF